MSRGAVAARRSTAVPKSKPRSGGRAVTVATWIALGVVPLVVTGFFLVASLAHESLAYDFRHAYLPAAHAVLDGESPYPALDDPDLAAETAYVYPPALAFVLTPLTPLSENAASVVAAILALELLVGTLLVLGVRDWRCYGAAFLWAPSINAVHTASSSLLLGFAAALAWRYRTTVWPLAASIGLAIAVKLVLWPLLVWTLVTRRLRATVWALVIGVAVALGSWAALAFEDLDRYPSLLRKLAELEAESSYSLVGVSATLGLGDTGGRAIAVAVGVALLAAVVTFARRADDFRAFTCALASALAFTPILWQHYLVLLLVPLAVARPRFSGVWLIPVVLWLAPREDNGEGIQTLLPMVVAAVLVALLLLGPRSPRGATTPAAAARR
jgi:alpha-1,2-mannosyltransferase